MEIPFVMPRVRTRIVDVEITGTAAVPNFAFDGANPPDRIEFANNGRPGVMVYFRIKDIGGTGLLFPPVPTNALSVNPGQGNPPDGTQWQGFVPLSVENDCRKLLVYCRNDVQNQQFKFTLHFVGPAGPKNWDPIGDGLNGPRGGFS